MRDPNGRDVPAITGGRRDSSVRNRRYMMKQQPIPEAAVLDENSVEMMRVWIAQKRLYTSLKVGMYKETSKVPEEKAWGMILADAARHVADALEKAYGADAQESLRAIRDAFARELASPSTDVEGVFVKKQ